MCSSGWQLISPVSSGFLFTGSFPLWSQLWSVPAQPETKRPSVTPPPPCHTGPKCERPSFIHQVINLQRYLRSFLDFHYQPRFIHLFFSKWLCCCRLFSESLSLPQGWSRQFQQLCFPFGAVLEQQGAVMADGGFGGFDSRRHEQRSGPWPANKNNTVVHEFGVSYKCVIMSH